MEPPSAPGVTGNNTAGGDACPEKPPSKRAQKKQAGKARLEKERKEQKRVRKEKNREERKQARETAVHLAARKPVSDQQQALLEERHAKEKQRMVAVHRKQRLRLVEGSGLRVIIDLSFEDKLAESEIKRLCQQIKSSYSLSSHSRHPVHLHLTSLAGKTAEQLARQPGLDKWAMSSTGEGYETALVDHMKDLVYLTSDATNVLDRVDPEKVYIIGGIVDKKGHTNVCRDKAQRQRLNTAKLPIEKHLKLAGTQVLSIDQVVSTLAYWQESKDWKIALKKAIPFKELPEVK